MTPKKKLSYKDRKKQINLSNFIAAKVMISSENVPIKGIPKSK